MTHKNLFVLSFEYGIKSGICLENVKMGGRYDCATIVSVIVAIHLNIVLHYLQNAFLKHLYFCLFNKQSLQLYIFQMRNGY